MMKKIGSITSAVGLIFYGIWLVLKNCNYTLAMEFFKWWPIIFVILGIEIIFYVNKRIDDKKPKLNYFIIPVILVFICTNGYFYTKNKIKYYFNGKGILNIDGVQFGSVNDSKKVPTEKQLQKYGEELYIDTHNLAITVQNSSDDNINIEGEVSIDDDEDLNKYEIKEKKVSEGYRISFDESYVRGVDITVSVPEGYYVKIDGHNGEINARDYNGNIDIDCHNSDIDLEGDIQLCNIISHNAEINLNNKICKDVNIESHNGEVSVKTQDSNLNLKTDLDTGTCSFNGNQRINSGINKKIGTGEDNLSISLNNGVINITN